MILWYVSCLHHALQPQILNIQNWSRTEKYRTYLTVCFFTFLATVNASKFSVAVVPLAKEFHVSNTKAGYLVCFNVLCLGVGNIFWIPLMRCIGKRLVYLIALPLLFAANIWGFFAKSYGSLLASCIVSGFAASAGDATVPAVVADLFFVQERGSMMMIFHMALSCGFFIGPLINAYIEQYSGWQWICGWISIATALTWVVAFFIIHETTYVGRDTLAHANTFSQKHSFMRRLALTPKSNAGSGFFKSFCDILAVALYPGVIWPGITVGTFVGWYGRPPSNL
jgi:MFS family permease